MESKEINEKLYEISKTAAWMTIKQLMQEEVDAVCSMEKIDTLKQLEGAKFARRIFNNLVRRVDGSKDFIDFGN